MKITPVIPEGYLFVAVTVADPVEPLKIMGWPTERRDTPDGATYFWPVDDTTVRLRCKQEGLELVRWAIVQYSDLPDDRVGEGETYRDGLVHDGVKLGHNVVKCREIKRTHLRIERTDKLFELDGQWMRAVGQKDKAEEDRIEAERQKWRDAPADSRIEAAQTVEELKQIKVV